MAFVLVVCVPCALMSIVLTPTILLPDYWLICPTCLPSLPSSFAPFIIFLCLPCPALPCPALPCPALPCPVLSCPVLSCPVLSCPILSCPVLSCPVLALPCVVLCCAVLCCPVLSCPVLSCPVLSCPCQACQLSCFPSHGVVFVAVLLIFLLIKAHHSAPLSPHLIPSSPTLTACLSFQSLD